MSLLDHEFQRSIQMRRQSRKAFKRFQTIDEAANTIHPLETALGTTAPVKGQIVAFPKQVSVAPAVTATSDVTGTSGAYAALGKRLFDTAIVLLTAVFWLPLIAICALLVAMDGYNPFYTQLRVGQNGRIFRMLKLRSMVPDADDLLEAHLATDPEARIEWDTTQKLKQDPRITRIGRIIRKTSIDELPQLFNVLFGDMSLVGPRPFMTSQSELYDGEAYYHLRPGLTGFWQVSDRNEGSFAGRVDFDEAYLKDMSLRTDLRVLTKTVGVVVRATGH